MPFLFHRSYFLWGNDIENVNKISMPVLMIYSLMPWDLFLWLPTSDCLDLAAGFLSKEGKNEICHAFVTINQILQSQASWMQCQYVYIWRVGWYWRRRGAKLALPWGEKHPIATFDSCSLVSNLKIILTCTAMILLSWVLPLTSSGNPNAQITFMAVITLGI